MNVSEIDTPALLVDLDLMEKNLKTMADFFKDKKCSFRPHYKTPKSPFIAWKQIRSGANGISCQKMGEAETLVYAGVNDLLITNEIVGDAKLKRLMSLTKHAPDLTVCVDHPENARDISKRAVKNRLTQKLLIDVNVGQNRCGVPSGEKAAEFARNVDKLDGIEVTGFQCYHGLLHTMDQYKGMEAKLSAIEDCNRKIMETKEAFSSTGVRCDTVSGSGTGTYKQQHMHCTEVQPGSYVLMDWKYHISAPEFERALTVLTTVMSVNHKDRVIVDCGLKKASIESGMPILKNDPEANYSPSGDEHGEVIISETHGKYKLGDKIELYPSHCDTTIDLHEYYYGVRDNEVEIIWPIQARGKSR
jgi:3-hydroxy-D-aspartate aldolase